MESDPGESHLLPEELPVRRRSIVVLDQETPPPALDLRLVWTCELEAGAHADARTRGRIHHDFDVGGSDQPHDRKRAQVHSGAGAQFGAAVPELVRQIDWIASQERFAPTVEPQGEEIHRQQALERLERQVLAFGWIGTKQEFVTEMRALVIGSHAA